MTPEQTERLVAALETIAKHTQPMTTVQWNMPSPRAMRPDTRALPGRIRYLREAHNLTQEEFGERIGIEADAVAELESGWASASSSVIDRIVKAFSVARWWVEEGHQI